MDDYLAVTHEVLNQPRALADYNLYSGDRVLCEGVDARGRRLGRQ